RRLSQDVHLLRDTARGFLDANNVGNPGETRHCGWVDICSGPARHIVEDERKLNRFRDCLEVLVKPLLGGLVVIRRGGENRLHAEPRNFLRVLHDSARVVPRDARYDGQAALDLVEHNANYVEVFAVLESRSLARGPTRNEEVNPLLKLKLHEPPQRLNVHGTVLLKG